MRPLWKDILVAVWLGMILPGIILHAFVLKERLQKNETFQNLQSDAPEGRNQTIFLRDPDGIISAMNLDIYLTGVVLAEMPVDFHEEALKAQSVSARTYTWKAYTTGGKHGDGSVCTDSACCQAYLSEETYLSRGGTTENYQKVRRAVETTAPIVLMYDGELIEATYFSSSGGSTEAALSVWGADYPYLQPVSSPEEISVVTNSYTFEEFQSLLGKRLWEDPSEWFGEITYTDGGGVDTMEICGENYTGVQLRAMLGLRSTVFSMDVAEKTITIATKGYGHRVGMSQYGANSMAEDGSSWQQILQHYYPGTTLVPAYGA